MTAVSSPHLALGTQTAPQAQRKTRLWGEICAPCPILGLTHSSLTPDRYLEPQMATGHSSTSLLALFLTPSPSPLHPSLAHN